MKIIFKNLFSLGFIHGMNLLIPLLVMPYLVKVIGLSTYGIISTAQNFVAFFVMLIDFGFNITAVRSIAQAKDDRGKVSETINRVFFLKLLLLVLAFFLFLLIVILIPNFRHNFLIYAFSFFIVIGQVSLPLWYYQAVEKINKTVLPIVISKITAIIFVFLFVKSDANAPLVNLFFGLGNLISGVTLFFYIFKEYKLSTSSFNRIVLKQEFRANIAIVSSNISVVIYTNSPLLILNFFVSPTVLGIFSVIDRVIQIFKTLLSLLHQVSYPRICNIVKEGEEGLGMFIKKMYGSVWTIVFLVCILLFYQSDFIISYFIKDLASQTIGIHLLKLFSFILFVTSLNMPFYQTLLAYKKDWITVKILLSAAVLSILLNFTLIPFINVYGIVVSMYSVEGIVALTFFYYSMKTNKIICKTII